MWALCKAGVICGWLRNQHFQTLPWKQYLQMHLLAERFGFQKWWSGVSKRGSRGQLCNGTDVASAGLPKFFCLDICSLRCQRSSVEFLILWPTSSTLRRIGIVATSRGKNASDCIYVLADIVHKLYTIVAGYSRASWPTTMYSYSTIPKRLRVLLNFLCQEQPVYG